MEGVIVRHKDGICRNVTVTSLGDEKFKRNTDIFISRGHYIQGNKKLHCCENEQYSVIDPFCRTLPAPFQSLLLFGDVLFILVDKEEETMLNFGLHDFRLFMENIHPELSPGHIIRKNVRRRVDRVVSIDYEEEEETTTQETTGTFITQETSEEEYKDDDDNLDD